jgi:hypothetical protein
MRYALLGLLLGAGLANSAAAGSPNMSLADYLARKKQISAEHRYAQGVCGSNPSPLREICLAEALGRDSVAKADLEVAYRSTPRTRYDASDARAEARFWVARERCDDGSAALTQDACVRAAKAVLVDARADAVVLRKAAEADVATDQACADASLIPGHQRSRACAARAANLRLRAGQGTK